VPDDSPADDSPADDSPADDSPPGDGLKVADILEASRGMLQKQLYAVFTSPTDGMGPVMANIEAHLAYQVELEEKGIMFGAGPFWTDDEAYWEGEGMVIIRAASLDEARAIAEADPMHQSGARSFRVRPWLLNEGSVTVKIRYSDGSREIV
jgi:uncharacterized protein YciI